MKFHCLLSSFIFCVLICRFAKAEKRLPPPKKVLKLSGMDRLPNGKYSQIEKISFSNNNFNELEPNAFNNYEFCNVKITILRHNNISFIADNAFACMSKMLQLDLHGNNLNVFNTRSFAGLVSLRHLRLSNNNIQQIDEKVLEPLSSLDALDLSQNNITLIQRTFIKGISITHLNLERNPLIFPDQGPILESFALSYLNLHSCNLTNLSSDAFSMLPELRVLDLSRNQLKMLPGDLLKRQTHLEYLDITFNLMADMKFDAFYLPTNLEEFYCDGDHQVGKQSVVVEHQDIDALFAEQDSSGSNQGGSDKLKTSVTTEWSSIIVTIICDILIAAIMLLLLVWVMDTMKSDNIFVAAIFDVAFAILMLLFLFRNAIKESDSIIVTLIHDVIDLVFIFLHLGLLLELQKQNKEIFTIIHDVSNAIFMLSFLFKIGKKNSDSVILTIMDDIVILIFVVFILVLNDDPKRLDSITIRIIRRFVIVVLASELVLINIIKVRKLIS